MSNLEFYEASHRYELGGVELPSVSELCRFLHREVYRDAPKWRMEEAARRGTAVHEACETLDKHGEVEVDEEASPYVEAYAAFLREHSVSWDLIEKPLYHPEDEYAGTIDRFGALDGIPALVDLKTTYSLCKPLCSAQLNLYRRMLERLGYPVWRLYILHLKKTGKYKLVQFEISDDLPVALLALHRATKNKTRR